jgi:hypothetical protein
MRLQLDGNTKDELAAKRNSVVKLLSDIADKYYTETFFDSENFDKYYSTMSGTVSVIDRELNMKGVD